MQRASLFVCLSCLGAIAGANPLAAQTPASPLPTLALDPTTPPSIWNGLTLGTEMFVVAGKHVKGRVGGAVTVGYRTRLNDNIKLAIDVGTGHTPFVWPRGLSQGADFAFARVKVGYEMGKLTPYLSAGGALAKLDNGFAAQAGADSFNALFANGGGLKSYGMVGAGVDYQVTNNLSLSVGVSVQQGGLAGLR